MIRIALPYYLIYFASLIARIFVGGNWRAKGRAKKESVESLIPTEWLLPLSVTSKISETSTSGVLEIIPKSGILTEKELEITENYTAVQLLEKLKNGSISAVEATTAFCKRAALAHQLTNCCTEFIFDDALKRATELDEHLASTGEVIGLFHGLPISLKDTFNVVNYDSTIGYISFIGNKKNITENSKLVKMLLDMGAVLYVKTNVPQTLMTADSDNNVMGRCLNPLNPSLSAGGSSGGEASLIRQRGSILGIGTDVGGSLRIPSLCCGTYAFKPSLDRIPYGGQTDPGSKDKKGFRIKPVAGPIANSFDDLQLLVKNVLLMNPWNYDNEVLPIPWNDTVRTNVHKKLRIGVIVEDKDFPVHPPIKRILQETTKKLSDEHEVILLEQFPSYAEMWKSCVYYYVINANVSTAKNIYSSGEPPIKSLGTNGAEYFGSPPFTTGGISKLMLKREKFIRDWNQVFIDNDLDVLLSPAAPSTAPPHDKFGPTPYTAAWNLTGFPSAVIPVGNVQESDKTTLFKTSNNDLSFLCAPYEQLNYTGGEGHIQLTCRNLEDEKLLYAGKLIDQVVHS